MNKVIMIVVGIVVLVVIGGIVAFSSKKSEQRTPVVTQTQAQPTTVVSPTQTIMEEHVTSTPSGVMSEATTVTVSAKNFSFTPKEIRVKKGTTVKVVFSVTQGFHDFVVDGLNVRTKQVAEGESETVEFVANKAGTFEYYCSVGTHRQMGMVGKLTVE